MCYNNKITIQLFCECSSSVNCFSGIGILFHILLIWALELKSPSYQHLKDTLALVSLNLNVRDSYLVIFIRCPALDQIAKASQSQIGPGACWCSVNGAKSAGWTNFAALRSERATKGMPIDRHHTGFNSNKCKS